MTLSQRPRDQKHGPFVRVNDCLEHWSHELDCDIQRGHSPYQVTESRHLDEGACMYEGAITTVRVTRLRITRITGSQQNMRQPKKVLDLPRGGESDHRAVGHLLTHGVVCWGRGGLIRV
jgi:hypothetical protein